MKSVLAKQINYQTPEEQVGYLVDFTRLVGTSTLVGVSGDDPNGIALGVIDDTGHLAISDVAIIGGATTVPDENDQDVTVAASKGVEFKVFGSSAVAGRTYFLNVRARTNDGQTREQICRLRFQDQESR